MTTPLLNAPAPARRRLRLPLRGLLARQRPGLVVEREGLPVFAETSDPQVAAQIAATVADLAAALPVSWRRRLVSVDVLSEAGENVAGLAVPRRGRIVLSGAGALRGVSGIRPFTFFHEAAHLAPWECSCADWTQAGLDDQAHQRERANRFTLSIDGSLVLALPAPFFSAYSGSRRASMRIEEDWADAHAMWAITSRSGMPLIELEGARMTTQGLWGTISHDVPTEVLRDMGVVIETLSGGASTQRLEIGDLFPHRVALIRREWGLDP